MTTGDGHTVLHRELALAALTGWAALPAARMCRIVAAAVAAADRTVRCWDTGTGQPVGPPFVGHTAAVAAVDTRRWWRSVGRC